MPEAQTTVQTVVWAFFCVSFVCGVACCHVLMLGDVAAGLHTDDVGDVAAGVWVVVTYGFLWVVVDWPQFGLVRVQGSQART